MRPFWASLLAITISFGTYLGALNITDSERSSFIIALLAAVIAYAFMAFLFGAIRAEDLTDIPLLNRFISIIDGLGKKQRSK